jgi:hypothetical protein
MRLTKDAGSDVAIKSQSDNLKKLREESIRAAQQQELLNRTQAKPATPPAGAEKPAAPDQPK